MRRNAEQHLALGQRLAHQPECEVLEIAEPAMDELCRGGGGCAGKIPLLAEMNAQAPPGSIARNAATIDAAPDDGEVIKGDRHATLLRGSMSERVARPSQKFDLLRHSRLH
jgi:hypothetical protein